MAKISFMSGGQQLFDNNGAPLAGGKVYFYEPGTTTLKDTYTTSDINVANTNPVILDANGRPDNATGAIWLDGEYKYKITDSTDVTIGSIIDNFNTASAVTLDTVGARLLNGSFEVDTSGNGTPDNWALTPDSGSTIAQSTLTQGHGNASLLFTSGGVGGGTAISDKFDVRYSEELAVKFTYKSSGVNTLNTVKFRTYDKDDTFISTITAYSEGSANPTSYTTFTKAATLDATAVRAEVIITGIDAAGTTTTAGSTTNFDGVEVLQTTVQGLTSWTPVLYGTTTPGAPTYTAQTGTYQRIDNIIHYTCTITISAVGGIVGNLRISGLPEVCTGSNFACAIAAPSGWTLAANREIGAYVNQNQQYITLQQSDGATNANLTEGALDGNESIILSGTYFV